jgi:hypothetical protein
LIEDIDSSEYVVNADQDPEVRSTSMSFCWPYKYSISLFFVL